MTMNQYGFKVNGSGPIDQLTYTYQTSSNKLIKVDDFFNDAGSKLGDFHYSGTKGSYDYSYDGNGNLVLDNNKAISSITYNPLNLPNQVSVTNKGTITYTYDAAGNKLKKTTVEGAKTTTTLYLGGTVYQNDTLQFISHEEGRTRWALHHYVGGTTKYGFEYDYFLKDHLGNVRMVLTQEKDTAQYIATMEAAYRSTENQLFYNIPLTSYARSAVSGYPTDNTTVPNDSLARVNGNGPKTGPSLLLKVMSGDVVDIATKSFYKSGGTVTSPNSILSDVINSLAGGIVTATSGAHGMVTDLTNSTSGPVYTAVNSFLPTNDPDMVGKPKAYLNWILLDDQFKGVTSYPQSGAIAVGSADVLNTLAYSGIPITKSGYLYIWVSNETPGWDVFFDNLSVKQYSSPITEETHYYPFGLTMAGISSKAAGGIENKYKWNKGSELQNKEFSDGSGLELYETHYRSLDPQLGRFWQIDSKPDYGQSLYSAMQDDPIRYTDFLGDTSHITMTDQRTTETSKSNLGTLTITNDEDKSQLYGYVLEPPKGTVKEAQTEGSDKAILAGKYKVIPHNSKKFPNTFELKNKKLLGSKSAILIHPGNFPKDTHGCQLVGCGAAKDQVTSSRTMLKKIHGYINNASKNDIKNGGDGAVSIQYIINDPPSSSHEDPSNFN